MAWTPRFPVLPESNFQLYRKGAAVDASDPPVTLATDDRRRRVRGVLFLWKGRQRLGLGHQNGHPAIDPKSGRARRNDAKETLLGQHFGAIGAWHQSAPLRSTSAIIGHGKPVGEHPFGHHIADKRNMQQLARNVAYDQPKTRSRNELTAKTGSKPLFTLDKRLEAPLIGGIGGAKVSARIPQLSRQKVGAGHGKGGTLRG